MRYVRVTYTVQLEYIETNRANIQAVMDDLKANPIEGMHYITYELEGGSFMHVNIAHDEESANKLNERESFNSFREQLKASGPVSPPNAEKMELVGANFDIQF
jgi:hypothetical protein